MPKVYQRTIQVQAIQYRADDPATVLEIREALPNKFNVIERESPHGYKYLRIEGYVYPITVKHTDWVIRNGNNWSRLTDRFFQQKFKEVVKIVPLPAGPKDWSEDFQLENGNYQNKCVRCSDMFFGHKRRQTCKVCAETIMKEPTDGNEAGNTQV